MKRRTKLLSLSSVLLCLGGISIVLRQRDHNPAVPFPGAVVILDDASWKTRYIFDEFDSGYLWANANTVLYLQQEAGKVKLIQRRITPEHTASPPEVLPIALGKKQYPAHMSPDGKFLGLCDFSDPNQPQCLILPTKGSRKAINLSEEAGFFSWSPDSRYLHYITSDRSHTYLKRLDAQTHHLTQVALDSPMITGMPQTTPDGRFLMFTDNLPRPRNSSVQEWRIHEVQGKKTVTTKYQKTVRTPLAILRLSPNSKRLLWTIMEQEYTWIEKINRSLLKKKVKPHVVFRWQVTDVDGKNEREIGFVPREALTENYDLPQWTPDSQGVYLTSDNKLIYLAAP